jgi:hypothetical protein
VWNENKKRGGDRLRGKWQSSEWGEERCGDEDGGFDFGMRMEMVGGREGMR